MKVYKLTVMVIDFDDLGSAEAVITELENGRFGNRCISPTVVESDERDIGEWDDDHPLNRPGSIEVFKEMFGE